jgi:hypothetical protein
VVLILVFPLVLFLVLPPRREFGVTKQNCARIEKGMTKAEVWAILGVPPGDYTGGRNYPRPSSWYTWGRPKETWLGPDCDLLVIYDPESGLVEEIYLSDNYLAPEPTITERVRKVIRGWFGTGSR